MGGSPNPDNPPPPSTSERFHLICYGDMSSSRDGSPPYFSTSAPKTKSMSLDDNFWGDSLIDSGGDTSSSRNGSPPHSPRTTTLNECLALYGPIEGSMVDRLIEEEEEEDDAPRIWADHDTICEGSFPKRLKTLDDVGEEEEEEELGKRMKEDESGARSSNDCDSDDDMPPSVLKEEDMIVLLPRSGLRKGTRRLHKIRKNFLKKRNLHRKFPLDAFVHRENDRNALLDPIVRAARILYLDEEELYFMGDCDDGPFSPSNELESLNSILSSLNFVSISDKHGDLEEVLDWIHNEVCNKIICYATDNSDKYSDNQLYTQFDEDSEKLLKWAVEKRVTSKLGIANVSESGRGAVASEDIGIGDKVLEIPESLIISEDIVQKADMYKVLENVELATSEEMFMLWIMKERGDKNSEFAAYFETLPPKFKTGLSFGDDARKALEGTGLDEDIWQTEQQLCRRFKRLQPIFIEHSKIFPNELYTLERFIWAYQLLHSHSMMILFSDRKWKTCLVPVAGFFNHSLCPHLLRCDSIDCDTMSLKFIASRPCKKGQQCYMSYGNLGRYELVNLYGFLPKGDNHHDVFSISYDLDRVRHEVVLPDDGNKWMKHMVRGSWLSNGGKDVLPEPLLAHLCVFSGVNCEDIPENEKETIVHSFLFSELLEFLDDLESTELSECLDDLESTDIFEQKESCWDVELALKYKDLDRRILYSAAQSCGTLLGRDQLLILKRYLRS